jgi:hypothetical protein
MKYYVKFWAILVLTLVSVSTFIVESIIKLGCLIITTIIAVIWMLFAPFVVNIQCPRCLTALIEYSFSFEYRIFLKVFFAYRDALDL